MDPALQQVQQILGAWGLWSTFTGVISSAIILGLVAYALSRFGGRAGK